MIAIFCLAALYTHRLSPEEQAVAGLLWEETECTPFDTLISCWNGPHPGDEQGYAIFVKLLQSGIWSDWIPIAEEGEKEHGVAINYTLSSSAEMVKGSVRSKKGPCTGFQIQLLSWRPEPITLKTLFASTNAPIEPPSTADLTSILLHQMPRVSQIALRHTNYLELSLPTAMAAAVGQVLGHPIDALDFCNAARDPEFGSYESWLWNAATASRILGDGYDVYVESLPDLAALHAHLCNGSPVVVAVRGYLPGCSRPYRKDHMVCIYGYDLDAHLIHAIDGGFPNVRASATTFPAAEFTKSWERTGNRACIIARRRA